MVLAPTFLLSTVALSDRGRSGGTIYAGLGAGIALSSLVVPPLVVIDVAWAWAVLASAALLTTAFTWQRWQRYMPIVPARRPFLQLGPSAWLIVLAFGMDGVGFVPHMLFCVDYIARTLALGTSAAALQWLLLGIGAGFGPMVGGMIGDRIGLGPALILAYATKGLAVFLAAGANTMPFLAVSSVLVGALTPGVATLSAARMIEPGRTDASLGPRHLGFRIVPGHRRLRDGLCLWRAAQLCAALYRWRRI
jgi:hypothetical protein